MADDAKETHVEGIVIRDALVDSLARSKMDCPKLNCENIGFLFYVRYSNLKIPVKMEIFNWEEEQ